MHKHRPSVSRRSTAASRKEAVTDFSHSSALTLLAVIASLGVLYFAKSLFIPVTLAIYLNLLLSPAVTFLLRLHIPEFLSAGFIVFSLLGIIVLGMNLLADPAETWLKQVPKGLRSLQAKVIPFTKPLSTIQELSEKVDDITDLPAKQRARKVTLQQPGLITRVAEALPAFAASLIIVMFLTYFLLATGNTFLRKLAGLGRNFRERRRLVFVVKTIQREISLYLFTVTTINCLLGCAVALAMYLLDAPNPLLWGALATTLNFAPYIGAAIMTVIMTVVGFMSFDSLPQALALPVAYVCLSTLEGNLVTPAAIGRRLALNPAVVFLSLVFWGWVWGVIGALLAVPIMVSLKVVLESLPSLAATGRLMER